jgi:predicted ATPase
LSTRPIDAGYLVGGGALSLPDQPGRSTMDTLNRFIGDRQMLMMLDNCRVVAPQRL